VMLLPVEGADRRGVCVATLVEFDPAPLPPPPLVTTRFGGRGQAIYGAVGTCPENLGATRIECGWKVTLCEGGRLKEEESNGEGDVMLKSVRRGPRKRSGGARAHFAEIRWHFLAN